MKLRDLAKDLDMDVGCCDHSCVWGGPNGMGTNGGCQCLQGDTFDNRQQFKKLAKVANYLLKLYKP